MVQLTCRCGKEFLTEAAPYVIIPKLRGTEYNCGCWFTHMQLYDDVIKYLADCIDKSEMGSGCECLGKDCIECAYEEVKRSQK